MLTIEDGSGVAGANSFVTLAEYEAEQIALFGDALPGSEAVREAALRRAWFYLKSLRWREVFPFPTLGGEIPDDVKTAQAILARFEQANPNGLQPTVTPGQMKVLTQVGEISWSVTGQVGVNAQRAVVMMADDMLKPFVDAAGNSFLLLRG